VGLAAPLALVFRSHWSPVQVSRMVPSPQSSKQPEASVVVVVDVEVVVVDDVDVEEVVDVDVDVEELVVDGVVVLVVVGGMAQPDTVVASHASSACRKASHTTPLRQRAAVFAIEAFTRPFRLLRQHGTASGRPQVERPSQRFTAFWQARDRSLEARA
jgi:hypothetical protein